MPTGIDRSWCAKGSLNGCWAESNDIKLFQLEMVMTIDALELYDALEKSFIFPQLSDDWVQETSDIVEFLTPNFQKRWMGLVCDFTETISSVFTAVFPSDKVIESILKSGAQNALLFVHHPATWDIRKAPDVFQQMDRALLAELKNRNIAVYNLHVPLDNFGDYSTSVCFARALKIEPQSPFSPYFGALAGVYGKIAFDTTTQLREFFMQQVGHTVSLYNYGESRIKGNMVAVIAGGGSSDDIEEISKNGVNTFVTGITVKNEYSKESHEFAQQNKINILGGTHYSTEKFACIEMINFFSKFGLPAEFVEDEPVLEDL
jgi:putative NIF3 family GTP cyclohydrolase 1 type 2